MNPLIQCRQLFKKFDHTFALEEFNLEVKREEIVALLGPSGCGKTTALRIMAGFENVEQGEVFWNGDLVTGKSTLVPPEKRPVGIVFQDFALFPHLSIEKNVAFGLSGSKEEKKARVQELLELIGLKGFGKKMPHMLSGGQQQRVALARALAPRPDLILFDEPFSSLDRGLSHVLRHDLRRILQEEKLSAVLVTHDQEEAFTFADQIVMMKAGRIVQQGTPEEVYHRPVNSWVASFVGEINLISAEIRGEEIHSPFGVFSIEDSREPTQSKEGACQLMMREEDFAVKVVAPGEGNAVVERLVFLGSRVVLEVLYQAEFKLKVEVDSYGKWEKGQSLDVQTSRFLVLP